jgi:hypothetical protein
MALNHKEKMRKNGDGARFSVKLMKEIRKPGSDPILSFSYFIASRVASRKSNSCTICIGNPSRRDAIAASTFLP